MAEAHAVCLALVALDLIARAWRIRWLLAGVDAPISFGAAFTANAFGDAACAVTPLRLGGEPARLAGMLRAGVPPAAAFVAISAEVLAAWPVIIAVALPMAWYFAPGWWAMAAPRLAGAIESGWPWVVALVALSVIAWRIARRIASRPRGLRPLRRIQVYWRRLPRGPLVASAPLTLVNVVARTGILMALALTLGDPPALGTLAFGSFALLYAQLVLPTPSGAGVVDFGFLGGAARELGGRGAALLLGWRFYSSGIGLILGVVLAVRAFGWPALRRLVTRAGATSPPA